LHVEQAQLIALWPRFPTFEQEAGMSRMTGHKWDASALDHWNTPHDSFFPFVFRVGAVLR
jgi:hypothetical protein